MYIETGIEVLIQNVTVTVKVFIWVLSQLRQLPESRKVTFMATSHSDFADHPNPKRKLPLT